MNSSGIKRGLAATAISALAVTGLPALAHADTLGAQAGAVELESVSDGGAVTVKNDGTNTTVSLVAAAPTSVNAIQFAYRTASAVPGAPTQVSLTPTGPPVARSASGEFQQEWVPPITLLNTQVDIFAFEVDGTGIGTPADPAAAESVATAVTVSGSVNGVEITDKPTLGYFVQPYAAGGPSTVGGAAPRTANVSGITGTTSGATAAVKTTIGSSAGAAGPKVDAVPPGSPAGTPRGFSATINLTGAAINGTEKEALARVSNDGAGAAEAEDAEGFDLYSQTIMGISAAAKKSNVPTGGTTDVVVTVTDQEGKPVSGAHVVAIDNPAAGVLEGTPTDFGYTDGRGQAVFTGASAGTHQYYVDGDNNAGFTNGVDRSTSVTITSFTPRATTAEATSQDGNAFDFDEYDASEDVYVVVEDQNGNPVANEFVFYSWQYTPFKPTATNAAQTFTGQAQTDANGEAVILMPTPNATSDQIGNGGTGGAFTLNGYVNRDATPPGQDPADLALTPQTLKRGESKADWNGPTTTDRQAGTDQSFSGTLKLADGTALAGRRLTVEYTKGDEAGGPPADGDSVLAPQGSQPSGTTRVDNDSAIVITDANGSYTVVVRDPAKAPAPQTSETGATLVVAGTATVPVTAPSTNNEGVGVDATDTLTINYRADAAASGITVSPQYDDNAPAGPGVEDDAYAELVDNAATPGRPVTFEVNLKNQSGDPLAGQEVTLTTNHGFFTDAAATAGALEADPEPSNGSLYGEWKDNGSSITVTTDANGKALVTIAIERDAGFDDDGKVTSTITATSGSATNSSPIQVLWSSDDALNPGEVEISPSEASARTDDQVKLNVYTRDQFGNLTKDAVVVTDDTADAGFVGGSNQVNVNSQYINDNPVVTATADQETVQNVTATWTQASNTYTDGSNATPGFQGVRTTVANNSVEDEATITWYDAAISDESVTMTSNVGDEAPVGTAVTETVTVLDQNGNPVPNIEVNFTQSGPGQDSDTKQAFTNANGRAFFTFVGTEEGTAFITAVVETGANPVVKQDEVAFQGEKKIPAALALKGKHNQGRDDRLFANAIKFTQGAEVNLFRQKKNGAWKKVASGIMNAKGNYRFRVSDPNGAKKSRYRAIVEPTDQTRRGKGTKTVR